MKVTNWAAHEWRAEHRKEVQDQLQRFLERVGRRGSAKSVDNALYHMSVFCSFLRLEPREIPKHVKGKGVYEVLDEFEAKEAIGIELDARRAQRAKLRLQELRLCEHGKII